MSCLKNDNLHHEKGKYCDVLNSSSTNVTIDGVNNICDAVKVCKDLVNNSQFNLSQRGDSSSYDCSKYCDSFKTGENSINVNSRK